MKTLTTLLLWCLLASVASAQQLPGNFSLQCGSCEISGAMPTATPTSTATFTPTITATETSTSTSTASSTSTATLSATPTATPMPTSTVSPVCASIPPQTSLMDAAGNIYTVVGGNVLVNGSSDAGGSDVGLLTWDGHRIWAQSGTIWFVQNGPNQNWMSTGTTGPSCLPEGGPTPTSTGQPATPTGTPTVVGTICNACGPNVNAIYYSAAVTQPCVEGTDCPPAAGCCLYVNGVCTQCTTANLADHMNSPGVQALLGKGNGH